MTDTALAVPIHLTATNALGQSAQLEIAGVDVSRYTRRVSLLVDVGAASMLTVEMLALDGFDLQLPAVVQVNVLLAMAGELVESIEGDGTKRYRWRRDP
jgi:hypothetical protein